MKENNQFIGVDDISAAMFGIFTTTFAYGVLCVNVGGNVLFKNGFQNIYKNLRKKVFGDDAKIEVSGRKNYGEIGATTITACHATNALFNGYRCYSSIQNKDDSLNDNMNKCFINPLPAVIAGGIMFIAVLIAYEKYVIIPYRRGELHQEKIRQEELLQFGYKLLDDDSLEQKGFLDAIDKIEANTAEERDNEVFKKSYYALCTVVEDDTKHNRLKGHLLNDAVEVQFNESDDGRIPFGKEQFLQLKNILNTINHEQQMAI